MIIIISSELQWITISISWIFPNFKTCSSSYCHQNTLRYHLLLLPKSGKSTSCVSAPIYIVFDFLFPSNIQHHVHYVNYSKHSAREISSHIIYLVTHSILMYSRVQKIRGILNAHSFTPTADSLFESCDVSGITLNDES